MCASLAPRPNAVMRDLGTRLCTFKVTKWHPTQWTAAAVCLELDMILVNSYEDAIEEG